mgnify:CR=1 FL=1
MQPERLTTAPSSSFHADWSLEFSNLPGGNGSDPVSEGSPRGSDRVWPSPGPPHRQIFPTTPGGVGQTLKGPLDAFVSAFSFSSGTPCTIRPTSAVPATTPELAIAQNSRSDLYIAGQHEFDRLPTYHGRLQRQSAGVHDGFVARIIPSEASR